MIKKILVGCFFLFALVGFSQEEHAWVFFNSKEDVATYLANPLTMLTQRAIDRRVNQGIAIDEIDVPITPSNISAVTLATGITVKAKSKWLNALHIVGTQADINALASFSFVDHIEYANDALNTGVRLAQPSIVLNRVSNKFASEEVFSTVFDYGSAVNQIQMFNGHKLHEQNFTGSGMLIAVLDAGFPNVDTNPGFHRIRDNNQIKGGYDFVNRNANFYVSNNHGAHVLSDIAGYLDGQFVGTAPDADFYLFVTEDITSETPAEESFWVEAIEEADRLGVDIVNSSLGYSFYDNTAYSYDYNTDLTGSDSFISRGAAIAVSKGMIVVNSAGNYGSYAAWGGRISMPADVETVLSIGAVNASGNYASFSSKGPTSDNRIKPDVTAQGQAAYIINTSGTVVTSSGTSFSSPILAGGVACLWQALPSLTNIQIMKLIKESASIYTSPNYELGYGIPNLELALNNALTVSEFQKDTFSVYPNPTKSVLYLNFPVGIYTAEIDCYDILGKKLFTKQVYAQSNTVSLNDLSSGIYFVKIKSENALATFKIIKE